MSCLFVGLGNPGSKYQNNRHNIGFLIIDYILENLPAYNNISKSKFFGDLYKFGDLYFLKPTTYMNDSGKSVASVVNYYNIDKVVVYQDDLDLDFGAIRFKLGGGTGGHNGLKSIDNHIGNKYTRVRIGISKPINEQVANYVLNDFPKSQIQCLEKIKKHSFSLLSTLIKDDINIISSKHTRKNICDEVI
ncbi:MAG: Peptidyl-tRNA hydrolase (EC [uncultured Campylobacterales bacterium]|uniref:Peptidyl-tRNA hydrolase n=1 Tax=uncultured Campylobacterales bacterium TaxID=352960 RepID=A0A6S6RZX0_9BACT|nr:MAG: Peptidyl-tRNA hydrolase (EC [uncultured Campylobacterales bacterium]